MAPYSFVFNFPVSGIMVKYTNISISPHRKKKTKLWVTAGSRGLWMCIPPESQQSAVRLDDPSPDRRLVQNGMEKKQSTWYLESVQGSGASRYLQLAVITTGRKTWLVRKAAENWRPYLEQYNVTELPGTIPRFLCRGVLWILSWNPLETNCFLGFQWDVIIA